MISDTVQRQTDRRQIYRYIYDNPQPLTAQEIAGALNFDASVVADSLAELLEEGMILRSGDWSYVLEPQARLAVGVSIQDDKIRLLAINLRGEELAFREIHEPFSHTSKYYKTLAQHLELFLDDFGLKRDHLLGVGITLPAVIDPEANRLVMAPTLELWDIPLEEIYNHFSHYPVYIENKTRASGYAERWVDGTRRNMVYLSLDRSVGGSLLLDGREYEGDHGRSGEFGHLRVVPNGKPCLCGRRGCLQAYCSTSRLSDDLGITLDEFFERLHLGDEQAAAVWMEYQNHLTDALANMRMNFDCDIVLGGTLSHYLEGLLPELCWELGEKTFFDGDIFFLYLDRLGPHGACTGTALRFVDDFLLTF